MKFLLTVLLLITVSVRVHAQYDKQNINFLGLFSDSTVLPEPVYGIKYQSCWGWVDPQSGKEYGIIGSTAGTYIVDVTTPTNPVLSDYIPHRQTDCIWHEYKTYGNYLYIISDDAGNNSLQIADLSYLPDSVHVLYDSTDIFVHSHTLFIDGNKMYVASVSTVTDFSSMNVYSLNDPEHPTLLRSLNQDYPFIGGVHDMFVSNDTVYASCGYDGLQIFKYDSVANQFFLLGTLLDDPNVYNHSSCLSPDFTTLYVCEEVPEGQPVKVIDVSNVATPTLVDTFYTNSGATPHNPYLHNNLLIIAAYQDGVFIYDVSNATNPVRLGYFDTYMANPPGSYLWPPYAGAWAAYADLPSGILLVSDMQAGLFCLDITGVTGVPDIHAPAITLYPNPASSHVSVEGFRKATLVFHDISGRIVLRGEINESIKELNISSLTPGFYTVSITGDGKTVNKNIVVKR